MKEEKIDRIKVERLFSNALVWDNTIYWGRDYADSKQLYRFHQIGIDVISITLVAREFHWNTIILRKIANIMAEVRKHSNFMSLCKTVDEILKTKLDNKIAIIFNFQDTLPFEDDINLISLYYTLGVRHACLAYNIRNAVGDGCAESTDSGLSRFGKAVVHEMNRVGMIIDGSHSGYKTTMEAMELTDSPFIFSHSNVFNLFPHYRNIKDDQIVACAKTGGVIGINGVGEFLDDEEASTESMFKHIDYIAQLVGIEHVGIGLDFVLDYEKFWRSIMPETIMWPKIPGYKRKITKYATPEQLIDLTELMLRKGYKENEVRGVLGENFLRVAKITWK